MWFSPQGDYGGENDCKKAVVPAPPTPRAIYRTVLLPAPYLFLRWDLSDRVTSRAGGGFCSLPLGWLTGGGLGWGGWSARCVTPFKLDEKQYVNFTHTHRSCASVAHNRNDTADTRSSLAFGYKKSPFFMLLMLAPSCRKRLCFMICSDLCYRLCRFSILNDSPGTQCIVLLPILDIQWTPAACDRFSERLQLQPWTTCRISSISQAEQMADVIFHMPFTGYLTQQPLLAAINTEPKYMIPLIHP